MLAAALVAAFLCSDSAPPSPADLAAYREARAEAGRSAEAHVKLALWCEARGLDAERIEHLAMAVAADADHPAARGLLDQVKDGDAWRDPEAVSRKVADDAATAAALAEYHAKRAKAPSTAEAQWRLALWCKGHGLEAEASAHAVATTRLDPSHEAAWKHLGYKRRDGRWMTDEQFAAEKAEAKAQRDADKKYAPLLEKWRGGLGGGKERKEEADRGLSAVADPRAVPSVLKVFGKRNPIDQRRAARLLGQIDAPTASRGLALLAVGGASEDVRREASEGLRSRDPRDVVELLIGRLQDEIKYEVRPVDGPGSPGVLFVEGRRFNVRRLYDVPDPPEIDLQPGDVIGRDESGLAVVRRPVGVRREVREQRGEVRFDPAQPAPPPGAPRGVPGRAAPRGDRYGTQEVQSREVEVLESIDIPIGRMRDEARKAAWSAREQLERDVAMIDRRNAATREGNGRVLLVLNSVTGMDFGADRERWRSWWVDQQGYAYKSPTVAPRPTLDEYVAPAYRARPQPSAVVVQDLGYVERTRVDRIAIPAFHSCFAAGTPVRTRAGSRPIEEVEVGDLVLSQDATTGAMSFRPVLRVFRNPPAATLSVALRGRPEAIVATGIHRFWKAGHGWVMARDLRPGDEVRTLGGLAVVDSVAPGAVRPVFNLEVAESRSFFVGDCGVLVHDNSAIGTVERPFDARPDLLAAKGDPPAPR